MTFTRASSTTDKPPRRLATVIWYPTSEKSLAAVTDAPPATDGTSFPVVLFSHGDGNEPTQATYLSEHLASWGFAVVAPPHPGNTSADCAPCGSDSQADSALNRVDDLTFALDSVLGLRDDRSQQLGQIIDASRTAAIGYSFGGWTVVSAAPTGRFNVVIAMAPGAPVSLTDHARATRVPTLVLGGGKDDVVDPQELRRLFSMLPKDVPHYLLFFPAAGHHAYRNSCARECDFRQERAHDLVNRYATAFLETYLVRDERYRRYLEEDDPPDALISYAGPTPSR
jgi:predicted dienelactone hydrolase